MLRQDTELNGRAKLKTSVALAVAGCAIFLGVAYVGFTVGAKSIKQDAAASVTPAATTRRTRPIRPMNVALGNMIYFPQDFGFAVITANNHRYESSMIAVKIENHLHDLREIYRQESARNPSLVGAMKVQFNIGTGGEVTQVKEISSTVADANFRNSVLADMAKWSFVDVVAEPLSVTCPLLFVREGMDIATLVDWERALGRFGDMAHQPAVVAGAPTNQAAKPQAIAGVESAKPTGKSNPAAPIAVAKTDSKIYQLRYPTALRKQPNFSAQSLGTFTAGTRLSILGKHGDWLEIKSVDNNLTGFIRKEFVVPLEVAGQ